MAKRHMDIKIEHTEPSGSITDATEPVLVRVRYRWTIDLIWHVQEQAWAMAWTRNEFLVYWRFEHSPQPVTVWLPREQVRRPGDYGDT